MKNKNFRIIYMGTPDFAVAPLQALLKAGYDVVGVLTNPDKPAGRGQKIHQSAVKKFAMQHNLKVLQPEKFRNPNFLKDLKDLKADLQVVVAFKMLPEVVWDMPRLGTLNLHASLLPNYRGAAPINWTIINGETETGVSTFLLKHEIDTGDIIFQEKVNIEESDNAGDIHDKLMKIGSELVVKTVKAIETEDYPKISQNNLIEPNVEIKPAPKIFKDDCKIDWTKNIDDIYNQIRGLSPYPTAFTEFHSIADKKIRINIKIFAAAKELKDHDEICGTLITDGKKYLKVAVSGGFISILKLQQAGKKQMNIRDFLHGFNGIEKFYL